MFSLSDIRHIGLDGLMGGEDVYEVLKDIIGDVRIEDLKVNYCAIATDIDTGEEKVFRKGRLIDAIRASISIPGVFRPYTIKNHRYVDGAMVNGLPVNRVHREEGDKVVAINLDTYESSESNTFTQLLKHGGNGLIPSIEGLRKSRHFGFLARAYDVMTGENVFNIITNSFFISITHNKRLMAELTKPDIYINIDLKGYDTHNFNSAEAICELGYKQTSERLNNK
ncbi:MAG: patatin-like phospholipase family protein [Bacteroidaceae bacterium]|nr:patatin-like phospholipase family protein [Bacteroidaceae bacterium]